MTVQKEKAMFVLKWFVLMAAWLMGLLLVVVLIVSVFGPMTGPDIQGEKFKVSCPGVAGLAINKSEDGTLHSCLGTASWRVAQCERVTLPNPGTCIWEGPLR